MATYPEEGKVTHPDNVGTRRMPVRRTAMMDDNMSYNAVKYGAVANTPAGPEHEDISRDLGSALKTMKKLRTEYPHLSPAIKMDATYE